MSFIMSRRSLVQYEMKLKVTFYQTVSGIEAVREWFHSLDRPARKTIGEDIKTVGSVWMAVGHASGLQNGSRLWGLPALSTIHDMIIRIFIFYSYRACHSGSLVLI